MLTLNVEHFRDIAVIWVRGEQPEAAFRLRNVLIAEAAPKNSSTCACRGTQARCRQSQ
jgi:hypothetical protein